MQKKTYQAPTVTRFGSAVKLTLGARAGSIYETFRGYYFE